MCSIDVTDFNKTLPICSPKRYVKKAKKISSKTVSLLNVQCMSTALIIPIFYRRMSRFYLKYLNNETILEENIFGVVT
jgi:hypothetical protein